MSDDGQHTRNHLMRLRDEIAGEIEALQDQTRQKIADLNNIDCVLRILMPGMELAEVRPKIVRADPRQFRGAVQLYVLDEIRKRGRATSAQITDRIMRERGLDPTDKRARSIIGRRTKDRLGALARRGQIVSTVGPLGDDPAARAWEIATPPAGDALT